MWCTDSCFYWVLNPNSRNICMPHYVQTLHTYTCKLTRLSFCHVVTYQSYSLSQDRTMCSAAFLVRNIVMHSSLAVTHVSTGHQSHRQSKGLQILENQLCIIFFSAYLCLGVINQQDLCFISAANQKISPPAVAISFYTHRLHASDQAVTSATHQSIDLRVRMTLLLLCLDFDLFQVTPEAMSATS